MLDKLFNKNNKDTCLCGSGITYTKCCKPYHDGDPVPNAEALMRARYSAYCLGHENYLVHTWHPASRPKRINLGDDNAVQWLKLDIVRAEQGGTNDKLGIIEFKAFFDIEGKTGHLHEIGNFVKEDNQWYYFDGEITYHNDDSPDDFKDFKPVRRLSVET